MKSLGGSIGVNKKAKKQTNQEKTTPNKFNCNKRII